MEGMRHVLVHDYDSVKIDTIWKTTVEDLPPLVEPLRRFSRSQEYGQQQPSRSSTNPPAGRTRVASGKSNLTFSR
jgi:hypothetical protein